MSRGNASTEDTYVPTTTYAIKQSFGGHNNFMASYGLKPGEEDEATGIVNALKEADRQQWEEDREQERGQEISGDDVDDYERYEDAGVYAGADPTVEEELAVADHVSANDEGAEYHVEEVGEVEGEDDAEGGVDEDAYDDPGPDASEDDSDASEDDSDTSEDESDASADDPEASEDDPDASEDDSDASEDDSDASEDDSDASEDDSDASEDDSDASEDDDDY